jgi:hypothetical protein
LDRLSAKTGGLSDKTGGPKSTRTVPETLERGSARKFKDKKSIIPEWIDDPKHEANDNCRHILELYAQLNDSEFS